MHRNHKFRLAGLFFITIALFSHLLGCTSKPDATSGSANDPKNRLNEYISKSFSVKSLEDRQTLATYLTGEARNRLSAWSDEQFRQAFIESKRQFLKLAFREVKNHSPTEVQITYELSYIDQSKGHDAKVTNKKFCQMVSENGNWLIRDVQNIKELIEFKDELSLP